MSWILVTILGVNAVALGVTTNAAVDKGDANQAASSAFMCGILFFATMSLVLLELTRGHHKIWEEYARATNQEADGRPVQADRPVERGCECSHPLLDFGKDRVTCLDCGRAVGFE